MVLQMRAIAPSAAMPLIASTSRAASSFGGGNSTAQRQPRNDRITTASRKTDINTRTVFIGDTGQAVAAPRTIEEGLSFTAQLQRMWASSFADGNKW